MRTILKMSSKRASVNPPGPVLEASVPSWKAGCLAAGPREAAEGEAAQGAARGRGKGKGRGWEEACGAPARLQEQAFPHLRLPLCVAIAACKPLKQLNSLFNEQQ